MARVRDILDQALDLTEKQRALLAHELLRSLDGPPDDPAEVERSWTEEIGRRLDAVKAGTATLYDWEDVRREIDADLRRIRHARAAKRSR